MSKAYDEALKQVSAINSAPAATPSETYLQQMLAPFKTLLSSEDFIFLEKTIRGYGQLKEAEIRLKDGLNLQDC